MKLVCQPEKEVGVDPDSAAHAVFQGRGSAFSAWEGQTLALNTNELATRVVQRIL